MKPISNFELTSIAISSIVLLICVFLLGELAGFEYGYEGALDIEFPGWRGPDNEFIVYGPTFLSAFYFAYGVAAVSCAAFLISNFSARCPLVFRLLPLVICITVLARGWYGKYQANSATPDVLPLNPYRYWIDQAVILDWWCIFALAALFVAHLWNWRLTRSASL